jgi:hypothetical protein
MKALNVIAEQGESACCKFSLFISALAALHKRQQRLSSGVMAHCVLHAQLIKPVTAVEGAWIMTPENLGHAGCANQHGRTEQRDKAEIEGDCAGNGSGDISGW